MAGKGQISIDDIIDKCVDDIWKKYDTDGNGTLDKSETRKFVQHTLVEMEVNDKFNDDDFDGTFSEFDKDGNGTISKDEMRVFIKKVAGFD